MADITLADLINKLPRKSKKSLVRKAKHLFTSLGYKKAEAIENNSIESQILVSQINLKERTYSSELIEIDYAIEILPECADVLSSVRENEMVENEFCLIHAIAIETEQKERLFALETQSFEDWFCFEKTTSQAVNFPKSRQKKEFDFESRLEAFLQVNDIEVERQVASNEKRIDLWIPGQLMIECKAGKVTGDDICQAVDYLATFERDVLLIGTGMTTAASRGIEAINKLSFECKLLFVTQEACFGYLKAVCK